MSGNDEAPRSGDRGAGSLAGGRGIVTVSQGDDTAPLSERELVVLAERNPRMVLGTRVQMRARPGCPSAADRRRGYCWAHAPALDRTREVAS